MLDNIWKCVACEYNTSNQKSIICSTSLISVTVVPSPKYTWKLKGIQIMDWDNDKSSLQYACIDEWYLDQVDLKLRSIITQFTMMRMISSMDATMNTYENCGSLHWYGLYPQWIRICTYRLLFRLNCLWHTWIWFVSSMDTKVTLD